MSDVTRILCAIEHGNPQAAEQLLPLVYDQLRKLAAQEMAEEKPGQTLSATALVHEAYLPWWAISALTIAVTSLPRRPRPCGGSWWTTPARGRLKRGGDRLRLELLDRASSLAEDPDLILSLEDSLTRLEAEDAIAAKIASLHLFGGLSVEEAGEVLGVSRVWPTETGSTPGLGFATPWGSNSRKSETFFSPTAHEEDRNSPYQISIPIHFGVQNE